MSPSRLRRHISEFFRRETAAGIVLVVATLAALVWANFAPQSYHDLWNTHLSLPGPPHALTLTKWINEGLMAVFFFVVGLEIKREFVDGELGTPRVAAVPIAAAFGGMVLPAVIFAIATAGTGFTHGWGIPMATDIAFAVMVFRVAGRHAPSGMGLMLLTLAVVDDLGAIIVIAVFYSAGISMGWLLAMLPVVALLVVMRRWCEHPAWYIVLSVLFWVVVIQSGIHATIAGVVLGLVTPVRTHKGRPVLTDLEHRVQPWSNFLVLPLFALANAGIVIGVSQIQDAVTSPLAIGIVLGLVVGKVAGITAGSWVAIRAGGQAAPGVGSRELVAIGLLGGIGFTVSLFVAGLSFSGTDLDVAKLAILAASLTAAVAAWLLLRTVPAETEAQT